MLTHFEHLQYAASALGYIDDAQVEDAAHGLHKSEDGEFYWVDANGWRPWDPDQIAEDAMYLAGALGINIEFGLFTAGAEKVVGVNFMVTHGHGSNYVRSDNDVAAAARRAIFNAASLIGQDKESPLELAKQPEDAPVSIASITRNLRTALAARGLPHEGGLADLVRFFCADPDAGAERASLRPSA
jgi:hypothetical protein